MGEVTLGLGCDEERGDTRAARLYAVLSLLAVRLSPCDHYWACKCCALRILNA